MTARVVVLLAVLAAVAVGLLAHPVLALGPLVCPGLPAALRAWSGRGGADPYDVSHRYR